MTGSGLGGCEEVVGVVTWRGLDQGRVGGSSTGVEVGGGGRGLRDISPYILHLYLFLCVFQQLVERIQKSGGEDGKRT